MLMKIKLLLLFCIGICTIANSQDKDLQVISSSAKSFKTDNLSLDWTLGEMTVDFLDVAGVCLSQGFHQSSYQLVAVKSIPGESGVITIFPNPFSDELMIKMAFADIEKGDIELLDIKGTSLWKKSFEGREVVDKFAASALPSGSYLVLVSFDHGASIQSYQLLKTQ